VKKCLNCGKELRRTTHSNGVFGYYPCFYCSQKTYSEKEARDIERKAYMAGQRNQKKTRKTGIIIGYRQWKDGQ